MFALIAIIVLYITYQELNPTTAIINSLTTFAALNLFSNPVKIWSNLALLTNPGITAYTLFIISINYFQLANYNFNHSLIIGIGAAMLGTLIGFLTAKYW